jgi:hypothetical protein
MLRSICALAVLAPLLSGCGIGVQCPEFAPPPSRQWALASCPGRWTGSADKTGSPEGAVPVGADQAAEPPARPAPPPPVPTYCYRSLADTECFLQPQAGRPGFTGTYFIPPAQ